MTISVRPSPQNKAAFDELDKFFKQLARPKQQSLVGVANAVRWGFRENFADERAGDEGNWEPLASRTVFEREKLGYPGEHPILVRSGDYLDTFINPSNPDHVEELTVDTDGYSLDVGSSSDKLYPNETGGMVQIDDEFVYVPPRPVTILGADQEHLIEQSLTEFFDSLL